MRYSWFIYHSFQSEGVSTAVYRMRWFDGDPRFNKMLIIIAARAQKPVCLKATVFLDISMETMTMVSQIRKGILYRV